MTAIRNALALAGATAILGSTLALAPAALASGGNDVRTSGTCSANATWKLKAKPDNGRLQVEAEVDQNRNGVTWAWTLKDNGVKVGSGSATTVAPSGSFTVRRLIANRAGADHITFRASNPAGQVCNGSLTF